MNRFFTPRRLSPRIFLSTLALVAFAVRAAAGTNSVAMESDANATIQMTSVNSIWDGLGWVPVNIRVENRANVARSWDFVFSAGSPYGAGWRLATNAAVSVPARSVGELTVFVAGPGAKGSEISILFANVDGPGVISNQNIRLTDHGDLSVGNIASSLGPSEEVRRMIIPSASSSSGRAGYTVEQIEPSRWPADWRVWSSFSSIVLDQDEYNGLDGARRNALREWVAQGGRLWLRQSSSGKDLKAETQLGAGEIFTHLSSLLRLSTERSQRFAPWQKNGQLITDDDRADWALSKPIVALVIFLVIFGLLVGPVNVFFFAPASKRHRLFVTVPVLSIAASLLLAVVIVVVDGFGGAGVRRAQVVLIPGENKAVVFQQQISRTGMLLNKTFPLARDTLLAASSDAAGVGAVREMERQDDTAGGAWFASRTSQIHELRRITPTRARVELVAGGVNDSAPVVQSSLTTVLRDFHYLDSAGKIWAADEVPPGKKVTLTRSQKLYRDDVRGYFRAQGGPSDLAPLNTHGSIKWTGDTILYSGRLEAASQ